MNRITPRPPGRSYHLGLLFAAFLAGLILGAGNFDVILPVAIDAHCGDAGQADPIEEPVGDYCRIRRDGLSEWHLALVADALHREGPSATDRASRGLLESSPHIPPVLDHE